MATPRRANGWLRCAGWALSLATAVALTSPAQGETVFEDSMAQRVRACTGCHGPDGRAASDGYYPRIAGKPAAYLLRQLRAFRDGQRRYALMSTLLAPLSDDFLREIAQHFASLDLPHAPPQPPRADAATLQRGRQLARDGDAARDVPACQSCHGTTLSGVAPDVPGLLGLPVDYLNAQLGAWRSGVRHALAPDCMAQIARRLAPRDVEAVAHWLASQPAIGRAESGPASTPPPLACGSMPRATAGGVPR